LGVNREKILAWLPSPVGDAVLCTPALRALRKRFEGEQIFFLAGKTVRQLLSPNNFDNAWVDTSGAGLTSLIRRLKGHEFSRAVLFKNSFGSAITTFLSGVPERIGYARDGRSLLLTQRIPPPKSPDGRFKPVSMIDYYLTIVAKLGCTTTDRLTELSVGEQDRENLSAKLAGVLSRPSPMVVLVPGGAFGPSKWWPVERFAATADWLIAKYDAAVVLCVAPNKMEAQIAEQICRLTERKVHSLAETPLAMGELKVLLAESDLVITNDTGPRHIAIALGKKVITLFGPNNPEWTQTGYEQEVQIRGQAECVPCDKPRCKLTEHLCMESISIETVCAAAGKILDKLQK
jgi:heptosyltransferase-2